MVIFGLSRGKLVMYKSRKRTSITDKLDSSVLPGKKRKSTKENGTGSNDFMKKISQSVFGKLVTKAGIVLSSGKTPNRIKLDLTIFQRNLSSSLKRHPNYPQISSEFVEGLESYIEDSQRFCLSLLPTLTSDDCDECTRGPTQDSLMRILLGIDLLQPLISMKLLEKIPEFSEDNLRVLEHDVPRLVINQFKWLDKIVNAKDLSQKLLEIISITNISVQREIVTAIPEILDDNEQIEIAKELIEIMRENSQLTVAILDTLSNLNLKADLLSEVQASVINMLSSTEMDDLPVLVKFILQSVADGEAFEAISELRNNLEITCSLFPSATSTPSNVRNRSSVATNSSKDGVLLTLDAIKASIRFRKSMADGWIKTLENVKSASEHLVVDVFVVLILYAVTNKRRPIETLLRNKIKNGCFTEDILAMAFTSYGQVLRVYFDNLLVLSEVLLRSPDTCVSSYAKKIYVQSFLVFDLYCKQEVVGALVTHVGSGFPNEADSSLDVLSDLVENNPSDMSSFAIFLKGILDYLDNLNISQIRKLFAMLSALAFHNDDGCMIQDDLHMVIRKQLSSNSVKYKRIGIIGAIMIVRSMAKPSLGEENTADTSGSQPEAVMNEKQKQIVSLLDLVRSSINNVPEAAALFYDELANVIEKRQLDSKTEAWISETVVGDFQDDFLIDLETGLPKSGLPVEFAWALDDADEGGIAFNLVSLLIKSSNKSASSQNVNPICSAPHFRLLRICEQNRNEGKLDGIDALLGCPVVMFKMDEIMATFSKHSVPDKELICSSLFYCLNWYRELINAFSTETDPEMKGKTLSRIQRITTLQNWLEQCLQEMPTFVPPLVHFDTEENTWKTSTKLSTKRSRAGNAKNKNNEHDKTMDEYVERVNSGKNDATVVEEKKEKRNAISGVLHSSKYQACFRELDLNVFDVLKCGLVSKAVLDSDMNTEKKEILQLQAPQLYFLLDDLAKKLEYSFSPLAKSSFSKFHQDKQVGFSHLAQKTAIEIVVYFLGLLPCICQHLETTNAFFQDLTEENDGLIDGPGRDSEEAKFMSSCFERLLSCIVQFLSWSGFNAASNKVHLKAAFVILSSRTKISKKSQPGFQELVDQTFRYFENFSDTLPSIGTAVILVKLLIAVNNRSDNETTALSVSSICGNFLKREWIQPDGQREQGSKYNENLQYLLKHHILQAQDPSQVIENITTGAFAEILEEKEAISTTLPTLTKSSFPAYYKTILDCLVTSFKNILSVPVKSSDSIEVQKERLVLINVAVRLFHVLVNLAKAFEHRSVLGAALKFGRLFVEAFVNLGMPALDDMLRTNKNDIHGLLKVFQQSTRSLQHFCGHSKVSKDISLTNHVPALKKSLETFVFRVKAMLAVNQCPEAFWIGNLKNRDLQGQEIMSQQSTRDGDDEQEESGDEGDDDDDDAGDRSKDDEESIVSGGKGCQDDDDDSCSESF